MKKRLSFLKYSSFACALLFFLSSCSVDDRCDLSKDLDMTIAVGEGLTFPVGSTEKIMLSHIIDTAATDVVEIDSLTGDFSITKSGTFTPEAFRIGGFDFTIVASPENKHYDFELVNLSDVANLPPWVVEEMKKQKYPFVVHEGIDYTTEFDVHQGVPDEIKKLRYLSFEEDVKLTIDVKLYSKNHESDKLLEQIENIALKSADEDGFMLKVPEYIVFADDAGVTDGTLILDGVATYNPDSTALLYKKEVYVKALDFTTLPLEYLPVEDGIINIHDELQAVGYVESDTVMLDFDDVTHIQAVDIECRLSLEEIRIKEAEGVFDTHIEPINEVVELNLGEELDFLKDAYFDFTDPRVYLSIKNPVDVNVLVKARFEAYDGNDAPLEGTNMAVGLELLGGQDNRFFINRYSNAVEGYRTVTVPELNNLIKRIPDKVCVELDAAPDTTRFASILLNHDYEFSGEYQLCLPMSFDEFRIAYTMVIEDIQDELSSEEEGSSEYPDGVSAFTMSFDILNTVPLELHPEVVAYDSEGNPLELFAVNVGEGIKKGDGVVDGVVTEPVVSHVELQFSAEKEEMEALDHMEVRITGSGSGTFNANEYIQLKKIVLSLDGPIVIDANGN